MEKLRFDISNDAFDNFFASCSEKMTDEQKEQLPRQLLYNIFRKGDVVDTKSTSKLSFLQKLFVLFKGINKRWYLVVEDNENGIGVEEFEHFRGEFKLQEYTIGNAEKLVSAGSFVLGSKELCESFHYMNGLSVSPAYNYAIGLKNSTPNKITEWKKQSQYIVRMISHYESNKKKLVLNMGMSVPEMYVLFNLFDGKEMQGVKLYKEKLKYNYNASASQIKTSFGTLQAKGYIKKTGFKKGSTMSITSLGIDKVNDILRKLIVNC